MTDLEKAARMALEALEEANTELEYLNDPKGFVSMRQERIMEKARKAVTALRQALEQPTSKQEVDPLHLSRILHELAGAASLCWTPRPKGIFDSQEAIMHVEAAITEIRERMEQQRIEELLEIFKDADQIGPLLGMKQPAEQEPDDDQRVMTVVYRNVQKEDVQSFMDHPKAVWFGWCHAPYQRDDARYKLEKAVTSPPASKPNDCARSHPHENMDAMCELRTEIARLTNENARFKAQRKQWVGLTDDAIYAAAEVAWRAGWAACRDAEFVGEEAEDEAWGYQGATVAQDTEAKLKEKNA